jgi:hypothetical protein
VLKIAVLPIPQDFIISSSQILHTFSFHRYAVQAVPQHIIERFASVTMHSFITLSFVYWLCSTLSVLALRIPFDAHVQTPASNPTIHSPRQSSSNGIVPVGNTQNFFYYTNITLGGQNISVMLDTGRYESTHPRNFISLAGICLFAHLQL